VNIKTPAFSVSNMFSRRGLLSLAVTVLATSTDRAFGDQLPNLLFIHGRGQGGLDPAVLLSQWLTALTRGAQNLGRAIPLNVHVDFPFFGATLSGFADAANLPLTTDIQARGAAPNNEFLAFQHEIAEEMRSMAGISDQAVLDEYGNSPAERGPLNWQWVQAILRALDKHAGSLSQSAIEQFIRDVYLYSTKSGVRDAVDAIVRAKFTEQPTIVVAHSLGSVVAYNVLRSDPRNLNVPLLVTVGCPLGIRAIRNQLIPLKYPAPVDAWYNAFDPRDVVALFPLDEQNFPVNPAVTNFDGVSNHTDNRHGIDGYLDDPKIAARILDGLTG
jgi:pimeloyl-ACP methyl ester carboxylesterase